MSNGHDACQKGRPKAALLFRSGGELEEPMLAVAGASVLRPSARLPSATGAFAAEHRSRPRAFHRYAARRSEVEAGRSMAALSAPAPSLWHAP